MCNFINVFMLWDFRGTIEGEFKGVGKKGQACVQLARILQFLECPQ